MTPSRAVVTGGSRGLGLAVAKALAERGWKLTLVARQAGALERVAGELAGSGHDFHALDVSSERSWRELAPRLGDVGGLVCAAGVLGPIGPVGSYDTEGFRRTIDVNLVGTLLAVEACLPALRARAGAIVTFSGGGATGPLPRFDAYAASKAAVVRLTENVAAELAADGVRVNAIAPGFVATDIHEATLAAGPEMVGEAYYERTCADLKAGGVPAGEAAELACLLLEEAAQVPFTGRLISAQWDPWRDPEYRMRLGAEPDLGTLRRIDGMLFSAGGSEVAR